MKAFRASTGINGIRNGLGIQDRDAVNHRLDRHTTEALVVAWHEENPSSLEDVSNVILKRNPFNVVRGRGNRLLSVVRQNSQELVLRQRLRQAEELVDTLVQVRIDERDTISLGSSLETDLLAMENGADHFGPYNLHRPRRDVLSILRLHDSVDEEQHLNPVLARRAVASDGGVVAVEMTRGDDRPVVSVAVEPANVGEDGRMRANPDVTGVQETRCCRVVHIAKALPVATVHSFPGDLNCQEHDLVAAFEKFESKVDVMEECPAEVGHLPGEEEDFHCVYASPRFV